MSISLGFLVTSLSHPHRICVYVSRFKNHLLIIFNLTINKILNQPIQNMFNDNDIAVSIQVSAVISNYTFSLFLYQVK